MSADPSNGRIKTTSNVTLILELGWNIPIYAMSERKLIYPNRCRFGKAVGQFFRESCVPGAKDFANDVFRDNPLTLCSLCVGNQLQSTTLFPTLNKQTKQNKQNK